MSYVDSDGANRRHTFDFVVKLHNGTRTAIAVKPVAKVESSGIAETVDRIRDQCPRAFADRFEVRTGDHITRNRAANARLILKSRRMRNDSAIAEVRRIASTLVGSVRVCDLLAASRNDGLGFMAVASLIGDGVLEHVGPGRISHNSAVRLGRKLARTH
ncbi:hypothetical protein [Microvirga sp. VF16]|uniref:hypothetical protein n=1 Tax=Microvirga sp. VF16 TaxID=2807101 RepID=UPI00193CE667|nr:hypothetical protein [Microvirga sp. VF16]QRM31347.1 hypothetical protein JO965_10350 [Microvirga sp. VF16]